MTSLATDELGCASLLHPPRRDHPGRDPTPSPHDRPPEAFRHARLLDHPGPTGRSRSPGAGCTTPPTPSASRTLAASAFTPLADLVAKVRREERYHLLHADSWLRLAGCRVTPSRGPPGTSLGHARRRWPDGLRATLPVRRPWSAPGLPTSMDELAERRWIDQTAAVASALRLARPAASSSKSRARGRLDHTDDFRWLWSEITSVRQLDPTATW